MCFLGLDTHFTYIGLSCLLSFIDFSLYVTRDADVPRYLDPPLVFEDSRLNNAFAGTSARANRKRAIHNELGTEERLNSASRLKIQIA